ncbi:tyrosine-type recombinase/integrase [Hydrocarboniphaga effusa]|uniref:tyrosine-type recombinase/integrase n=1 Tax=Hydrocarboniphaga effusa TaxID=243629 RepID=UPI003BAC8F40
MPLSDTAVRNAKPADKAFKLTDERGMYLLVQQAGKYWRLDYRFGGKRRTLALGVYPDVSLKAARDRRDDARRLISEGIDPGTHKKLTKAKEQSADSFEAVALEWLAKFSPNWTPDHGDRIKRRLEVDVFPWLGARQVGDITPPELLATVRRIEGRGALETAHRALQNCGQVFRYAVATGRAVRDPSGDLRGALPPVKEKHHASITDPKAIGELLRSIQSYKGHFATISALRLAPLVFVRPGELRHAEWAEFDLTAKEWRIPGEKMKARAPHIVPLSDQAVAILEELQPLTGRSRYVFPSVRTNTRPMSEITVLAALRRLGYKSGEMTGHGFRSMASTLLNEQGWNRDAIERQLAHAERNNVRAAYNYAEFLPERRKMMQAWADYLDRLAEGGNVVAGNFGRAAA